MDIPYSRDLRGHYARHAPAVLVCGVRDETNPGSTLFD